MSDERILILGRESDPSVQLLATLWHRHGARVLTPFGLSVPGWRHDPNDPSDDVAMVDGEGWPAGEISGVVNRLEAIEPIDLVQIQTRDRGYVAQEMTAFLTSWLSALECPQLNRPTPDGLCGPAWTAEKWVRVAAELGIPVRAATRRVRRGSPIESPIRIEEGSVRVVVVGGESVGAPAHAALVARARTLAEAAGTSVLEAWFADAGPDARFIGAGVVPPIDPAMAAIMLREIRSPRSREEVAP